MKLTTQFYLVPSLKSLELCSIPPHKFSLPVCEKFYPSLKNWLGTRWIQFRSHTVTFACEIWSSCSGVDEDAVLLQSYAVLTGIHLLKFRNCIMLPWGLDAQNGMNIQVSVSCLQKPAICVLKDVKFFRLPHIVNQDFVFITFLQATQRLRVLSCVIITP